MGILGKLFGGRQVTPDQMRQHPNEAEYAKRAIKIAEEHDPTVYATYSEEASETELTDKDKRFIDGLAAYYQIENMQELEGIIEEMTPMENDMLSKAKTDVDLTNLIQHIANRLDAKEKANVA